MTCTEEQLEKARQDLLDLTTRSRLIDQPRERARIIEVVDERGPEVFRLLVHDGKAMSFLPAPSTDGEEEGGPQSLLAVTDEPVDDRGVPARHTDSRLQTNLGSVSLDKRLRSIEYAARDYEQEQGVNVLFLAIGFLEWYESPASDRKRLAPLVLVPVILERKTAAKAYKISFTDEDLSTNLSLAKKLEVDFGLELPQLEEDIGESEGGSGVSSYFERVRTAIGTQPRWSVREDDLVLGLFSFAKFMMYRDLDPAEWPLHGKISEHPNTVSILCDGFGTPADPVPPDTVIDDEIDVANAVHVLDADSSQTLVIEAVRRGANLVVQGPPGTGKSQTITNIVAAAVADGKKVLFVAEKMAALSVVARQFHKLGLDAICLELHSHKARKKRVLEELDRTWALGKPQVAGRAQLLEDLRGRRDELNRFAGLLHGPVEPASWTPFALLGQLVRIAAHSGRVPDVELLGSLEWSRNEFRTIREKVERLAAHLENMDPPGTHAWRGVQLTVALPGDEARLADVAGRAAQGLDALQGVNDRILAVLGAGPTTLDQAKPFVQLLGALQAAPAPDREALARDVWVEQKEEVERVVGAGESLRAAEATVDRVFVPEIWEHDLAGETRIIRAHRDSFWRFLSGEYRGARRTIQGFARDKLKLSPGELLFLLERLPEGREFRVSVEDASDLGEAAFGDHWRDAGTDFALLRRILDWVDATEADTGLDARSALAACNVSAEDLAALESDLRTAHEEVTALLDELIDRLSLDTETAFGVATIGDVDIDRVMDRVGSWVSEPGGLRSWVQFRHMQEELEKDGLADLIGILTRGAIDHSRLLATFERNYFESVLRKVYDTVPELRQFSGSDHERLIERFQRLDEERIKMARAEVAAAHHVGLPVRSGIGATGTLTREISKSRRHLPIRKLLVEAGEAVQSIKPVFMMSPLSVAQYLTPGRLAFDLVVMDEASQIRPVEALGAIARGDQVVVVGDDQQLPPTRFFDKIAADDSAPEEELTVGDMESVLGLCAAQGLPRKRLRWHYRSRHESLIAVSNREFYDSELFIVPSNGADSDVGLRFRSVEGIWDRGGSSTNPIEAKAVAAAVLEHASTSPHQSLGVGTFGAKQRDAILDELEVLRRTHPEHEGFFGADGVEPFFVKNLESLQGDERDVIFISVGFGRDKDQYFGMNFGPLNSEGGERRLNVLMSRARRRCEVFSSIRSSDIDLNRARSRGAAVLRTFLRYAEHEDFDDLRPATGRPPDSVFEEEVARAIRRHGYEVHHQVGLAGFFVDLAVVHPEFPVRYLLGIECDGATYHSSRSARERDRQREQVLTSRGWAIHRVWSTDWFHDPEGEVRKVLARLDRELTLTVEVARRHENASPLQPHTVERTAPVEPDNDSTLEGEGTPYIEADFQHASAREPHEAGLTEMGEVVTRIVEIEGPIHVEELGRRVAAVWGKGRAGLRIQKSVAAGAAHASDKGLIREDGDFYLPADESEIVPRSRRNVESSSLKKAEMISDSEIRTALYRLIEGSGSAEVDEVVKATASVFGFDRLGPELRERFQGEVLAMLRAEVVALRDGRLTV